MLTARAFVFLGLNTLLGLVGVVAPVWAGVSLALDVLLLAAVAIDYARTRGVALEASRHWPPLLVQGARAEVAVSLSNLAPRPLSIAVRESLHPGLAAGPVQARLEIPGLSRLTWTYPIAPRRRGEHAAGPLMVRLLGPWGLAWRQRKLAEGESVRVYPQVRWEGKAGRLLLLAHRRALGQTPVRLRGLGREPYALREYLPGDPPDRIHWKATARHGHLVSREDTWEKGARLVVLLDCARAMSGRDGERSKLDYALGAALALVRVAAARGDRVTMMSFTDHVERTVRLHGGRRGVHAAYATLYDVEARLVEPAFDLAAEAAIASESRRATVVVFTSVVDLAAAELLQEALLRLERRHRPILVNLEDPELVALALGAPADEAEAFAKVSALGIQLANRRLATRLRHAGIRVLSAPADRLAVETLSAYLETLSSGR